MIAPLFKKNTLEQTQFEVLPTGFRYRGLTYEFSDVVETKSYRVVHQTKHIPMGVTTSHDPAMSFLLLMKDGEQVQVTEQSTLTSSSSQSRVWQLQKAYDEICAKSFDQRVKKYTDQVEASGFFEYNGWRFFPQQRKVVDTASKKAHAVTENQFLRHYGFIEVVPKQESFGSKLLRKSKQELSGNLYGFGTLVDSDVFFALLAHYFQMRWE